MLARLVIAAALCFLMAVPAALASPTDDSFGSVNLRVEPTVEVTTTTASVPLGSINATDPVCATVGFEVHANGQEIKLSVGASVLYKDDNPSSTLQIPVDQTVNAQITAVYGPAWSVTESGLPTLLTSYTAGPYGNVPVRHTVDFVFTSGAPGAWSYPVNVNICWKGNNAELFQGRYSGAVVLWASYVGI